jgi:ribonuclease J
MWEEVVLRDRQVLAKDGIFVIIAVVDRQTGQVKTSPDIISRGFILFKRIKGSPKRNKKKGNSNR